MVESIHKAEIPSLQRHDRKEIDVQSVNTSAIDEGSFSDWNHKKTVFIAGQHRQQCAEHQHLGHR